jgi:hypothetical protein
MSHPDRFDVGENLYSLIGPKLVDSGYSAIPIEPGTKKPGRFSRGRWSGEHDWQRFCERLPTEIETHFWSNNYRGAGVGVALGYNQVVAVDIDSNDPTLTAEIESLIGRSPVGKVGNRGVTWFFRAGPGFKTTHFKCSSGDGIDLLGPGTQTVIPPTIHPVTGKSYRWREDGESLELVLPGNLPMLPADIAHRVGEVMRRYGWIQPVLHEHALGKGNGVFDAIKAAAMDNLDAWLPELEIMPDHRTRRFPALWRGGDGYNVKIYPDGFHDFGGGRNEQMSAIDVVMAMLKCNCSEAAEWLKARLNIEEPTALIVDFRTREPIEEPQTRPVTGEADDFPAITGTELWAADVVEPWMLVPNLFQGMKVNNLVGDSGLGKSLLLLSLFMCIAAGKKEWFRIKLPFTGHPCVFFTAEENKGDAKKRLHKLAKAMEIKPEELANLHIIPMGGSPSTVLGEADTRGKVSATMLWRKLEALVRNVQPIALGVDPVGEVLDGDDINKRTVRSFMALLRPLAEQMNMCVILASHPSMAGIANKTGRFGNVPWRASFRGAAHFYREGELGDVDDGRRTLVGEKVQDGKPGCRLEFSFNEDGVLERLDKPVRNLTDALNAVAQAEYDFLAMFDKLSRQETVLLLNEKSPDYAPRVFARRDGTAAAGVRKRIKYYETPMFSLLDSGRMRGVSFGRPSDRLRRLERSQPTGNLPAEEEEE